MYNFNTAIFSEDRKYRYALRRSWEEQQPFCLFIGLNPSTADETNDDPTIRRCIGFAKDWGYGGLYMANLFAFRATKPKDMKLEYDSIGIENNEWLLRLSERVVRTIAVWGIGGGYKNRDKEVVKLIPNMFCLGTTKHGFPKHPLYLNKNTKLLLYIDS